MKIQTLFVKDYAKLDGDEQLPCEYCDQKNVLVCGSCVMELSHRDGTASEFKAVPGRDGSKVYKERKNNE